MFDIRPSPLPYCSYYDIKTMVIYIHYFEELNENLAFKALIYDVDHECMHIILSELIGSKATVGLDNKLVLDVLLGWLNKELKDDVLKAGKISIKYG
jgi:hypothetical protein